MTQTFYDIWEQSLALLYMACEPLVYDCRRSKEEVKQLQSNIELHTWYCYEVKKKLDEGVEPLSWDVWIEERNKLSERFGLKKEIDSTLEEINKREFSDQLTRMYNL